LLGRTFTEAEGQMGGPEVVLLSEGLWRQSFQADPDIVGKAVRIGGKPHTVVGVMPSSFYFPESMGPELHKGSLAAAAAHGRNAEGPRLQLFQRCG
jgi:hypothetical protein